jgi:DNA-binding transcriptional regulator YbjK
MKGLKEILESVNQDILTEDTLARIQESFDAAVESKAESRVQLAVESALLEMDEDHADKLTSIVSAIDEDHTQKLNQVVESIENDHVTKLKKIVAKYERELNESAKNHIEHLTEELDKYLDAYLEEVIPKALVEKAAKNTYASRLLAEAKTVLSVDDKFATTQIRAAVKDGAKTISTLEEENKALKKNLDAAKAKTFLEKKTENLPVAKAQFIKKRLSGKPLNFIKENFEFVEKMFEEKNDSSSNINRPSRIPSVDRQASLPGGEIVTESSDMSGDSNGEDTPAMHLYMSGLVDRH